METEAKHIMGDNFIGSAELHSISSSFLARDPFELGEIPAIPFEESALEQAKKNSILILGIPLDNKGEKLTINRMREFFGQNPDEKEPCFYNQDWYVAEPFATEQTPEFSWYLLRKEVMEETRGKNPGEIQKELSPGEQLPSAVLTAYAFFAYFLVSGGETLWKHDFIWCADRDHNGDQIYTGRYEDPTGVNKKGFNVHRHLSIRNQYGAVTQRTT